MALQQRFRIHRFVKHTGFHGGGGRHVLTEQYKSAGDVGPQLLSRHLYRANGIGNTDSDLGQTGKELGFHRDTPVTAQRQHKPAGNGATAPICSVPDVERQSRSLR